MSRSFVRRATFFAVAATLGFAFGVHAQALDSIEAITGDTAVAPYAPRTAHGIRKTVIVLLSGDSVAALQQRFGRELSQAERNAIKVARAADHAVAKREIERRGGDVLASLYGALNGIKVSIPESRLAALRAMPGVVAVKSVGTYERTNATSVPLIGAPQVWQGTAHFQGQGVKIAVIDTGIDYTHANFGGPGTVAAYTAAKATNTSPADPSLFGPAAPKVKGGTDLVGDAYNGGNTPVPDPNPLDCEFTSGSVGHGSHVAGTAAGFGVKADGTTFAGPWNAAAYTPGAFSIGPGVAPQAEVYSVRVFGCSGTTNVVAEAIDWAVANGMNVINMSLGSSYGNIGNGDAGSLAEQTAVANAAAAGIVVVASSGNAGPTPYITGAPAVFPGAVSVAATDALASIPVATLALAGGPTITVQNSNNAIFANGSNWPIVVLRNPNGTVSLGCNPDEYDKTKNGGIDITGKLVVTVRGTCARVFRAGATQHFGGAASAMINTAAGYPAYEGPIAGGAPTPIDGNIYEPVTIPFFGVLQSDTAALTGPTGGPAPASALANNAGLLANPGFERIASFSSAGPRIGDSVLRPGVTAPGVATVSTASGTGNGFETLSGTSMAAPHVAGVAALIKQANPTWSVADLRAALVQTASPTLLQDYSPRNEGSGLVQPLAAVGTQAVVRMPDESLSFGFADLLTDFSATKQVDRAQCRPQGGAVQHRRHQERRSGQRHRDGAAVGHREWQQRRAVPGDLERAGQRGHRRHVVPGHRRLRPADTVQLAAERQRQALGAVLPGDARPFLTWRRPWPPATWASPTSGGALSGTPGFYTWGLYQPVPQNVAQNDIRAVGTRLSGTNVFFGVNTHNRTSTALAFQEIDVCIDTSGGPVFTPNKVLIGINQAAFEPRRLANTAYATALFPTDANCNINGNGSLLFNITHDPSSFLPHRSRGCRKARNRRPDR